MNVIHFETIDSTNAEARRRAEAGERGPLWIVAGEQTAGRGRLGRSWVSEPGNVYATYLFGPGCGQAALSQLGFVAALAVADTLAPLGPQLKWPNDVLVGGAKISGILSETVCASPLLVAIGIGINVLHAPKGTPYPVTCWAAYGTPPDDIFESLAAHLSARLDQWRGGFETIRADWGTRALQGRAEVDGRPGVAHGLAEDGALLFEGRKVYSGDVRFLDS